MRNLKYKSIVLTIAVFTTALAVTGCGDDDGGSGTCPQGQESCGGECVSLDTDRNHCGACDNACDSGYVCDGAGECALSCQDGLAECSGSCTDTDTDRDHCGACDNACDSGYVCDGAGECALSCQDGLTECSGSCTDTDTDRDHCGACDNACDPGFVCDGAGDCAISCQAGLTECGGGCVDTDTNPAHCGACDNACDPGESCDGAGNCSQCGAGLTACDGNCIDTSNSDPANCGGCGVYCGSGEQCDVDHCVAYCDGIPCVPGDTAWSLRAGDTQWDSPREIRVDPFGDFLVLGGFEGDLDFRTPALTSAGDEDTFLAKFDAQGRLIWDKRLGDSGPQYTRTMDVDSQGNIAILINTDINSTFTFDATTVTTTGYYLLAKLDPNGKFLWNKEIPAGVDAREIVFSDADQLVVSGGYHKDEAPDLGGGALPTCSATASSWGYCPYLMTLDPSGNHLWSIGGDVVNSCFHQAVTTEGSDVLIAGGCNDDSVYDLGCGSHACTGEQCQYSARFDSNGNCVWNQHYPITGSGGFQLEAAHVTSTGEFLWHGWMSGTTDHGGGSFAYADHNFVVYQDLAGTFVREATFIASVDMNFWNGALDANDNLILGGGFTGTLDIDGTVFTSASGSDDDAILIKLDPAGNFVRGASFGSTTYDYINSMDVLPSGLIIFGGGFDSTIDLGNGTLTTAGSGDIFLAGIYW